MESIFTVHSKSPLLMIRYFALIQDYDVIISTNQSATRHITYLKFYP